MKRKLASGFFLTLLTAALSGAGTVFCLFRLRAAPDGVLPLSGSTETGGAVCLAAAAFLSLLRIPAGWTGKPGPGDFLPVAVSALCACGLILLACGHVPALMNTLLTHHAFRLSRGVLTQLLLAAAAFVCAIFAAFADITRP